MNGTIKVKSKINEGSVFTIKIPFEKTDQQQITKKVIQQDNKILNNCLIYIADDNHENLLVISDLLLVFNKSIKIKTALNGLELLELVNKKNPDIIILDLDMPKLNGIETLRILRKKYDPNLKIIGNTAGLVSVQKNELIEMGFDDFIYKPFTGSMLLDVIINTKRAY
jgi:two-component system CheB/CheR fusion protein